MIPRSGICALVGGCFVLPPTGECADRPLAPEQPQEMSCEPGPRPGTIRAQCKADVATTDQVDFALARSDDLRRWAYVHYTADVDWEGVASAVIPGLTAGTEYMVNARAHSRGTSEGWSDQWSVMTSTYATCVAQITPELDDTLKNSTMVEEDKQRQEEKVGVRRLRKTRWIEVYRLRGPGYAPRRRRIHDWNTPDFLDNHNSGDANWQLSHWGTATKCHPEDYGICSYTRYCVEVLDEDLTTSWHAVGFSRRMHTTPFSVYKSCDRGVCHCPNRWDAIYLEKQIYTPMEYINMFCPQQAWVGCLCDKEQLALSMKYTGRWTFSPPFQCGWFEKCDSHFGPEGYWYHHPEAARCRANEQVGDNGCTWKRYPLTHTVSARELQDAGSIGGGRVSRAAQAERETQSIEKGLEVFRRVGAIPCGALPDPALHGRRHNHQKPQQDEHWKKIATSTPVKTSPTTSTLERRLQEPHVVHGGSCLLGDSFVYTKQAGKMPLQFVALGMQVLTQVAPRQFVFEPVLCISHEQHGGRRERATIFTLEHAQGEFRATPMHLVKMQTEGKESYETVQDIQVGQELVFSGNCDHARRVRVLAARRDYALHSLVAPLTPSGLLTVDNVTASSYASIRGVSLSHASMHAAFSLRRQYACAAGFFHAVLVQGTLAMASGCLELFCQSFRSVMILVLAK
eukprot:TRINITY_DN10601_c0_g1_i3.p1 TRINITY_DN10601_c0_g1~~TRINITY_DN10601_c0_g1_i3.p1  ORF type:complete len:683 (+),score=59.96 TRINITY_DN10601_c0_g1_i3:52-2100(+)